MPTFEKTFVDFSSVLLADKHGELMRPTGRGVEGMLAVAKQIKG
jgi:hypothetical protein